MYRKKTAPKRTFDMDAARNKPREGGYGQGKPYQKQKIGQKMEGGLYIWPVHNWVYLECYLIYRIKWRLENASQQMTRLGYDHWLTGLSSPPC